ncbi:MAG TPA: PQQ-binding-like beta-propeller repeat protein, partial [Candidatus Kapabacteria bacterium]|nr:PQQ-binding-like beta-propeller repeat protein [Candidatus Kapabacteria bacterium]
MQFFLGFALVVSAAAADWPQWRGPNRDGYAAAEGKLINSISNDPKTIWKVKVGLGLASPVVAGDKVIHFDAVGKNETLHALKRDSGEKIWSAEIDATFHDNQGPDGPRCTPLVDGDKVYAVSCRGRLVCLNLANGKEVWSKSYTEDFGAIFIGEKGNVPGAARHGNNGTPLIVGDRLYACAGGTNGAGVVCLNKKNGELIWKSQNDQAAYAPPVIAKVGGMEQLLCFTVDGLISLDPAEGELFWRVPIKTAFGRHVTAPVWSDDVVVVSSHQAGLIGTKVSGRNGEQAWVSKDSAINTASPVSVGKYLYGLGPRKNLICVEIATGKQMWSKEGYFQGSADKAYGGFMVIGENVLCLTDTGSLVMFAASPNEFKEVGQAQVCGANWCNPAYADGVLYLRD